MNAAKLIVDAIIIIIEVLAPESLRHQSGIITLLGMLRAILGRFFLYKLLKSRGNIHIYDLYSSLGRS